MLSEQQEHRYALGGLYACPNRIEYASRQHWWFMLLPLNSPHWKSFSNRFGTAENVPNHIANWCKSIVTNNERDNWHDLVENFYETENVTSAVAYAVIPYMINELERFQPKEQLHILHMAGEVEYFRLPPNEDLALPDFLSSGYIHAIDQAKAATVKLMNEPWDVQEFRLLLGAVAKLSGKGNLGWLLHNVDMLAEELKDDSELLKLIAELR